MESRITEAIQMLPTKQRKQQMVEIIQMILLNLFIEKNLFSNDEKTRDDLNPLICFLNHEFHEFTRISALANFWF